LRSPALRALELRDLNLRDQKFFTIQLSLARASTTLILFTALSIVQV